MFVESVFVSAPGMNGDPKLKDKCHDFFCEILSCLNWDGDFVEPADYSEKDYKCLFVGSGGSEFAFLNAVENSDAPVCLITTDNNSSLAAGLEMLTWLRENGRKGEILHGSASYIAANLKRFVNAAKAAAAFRRMNFGVFGRAVERIASFVPEDQLKEICGKEITWVPMEELFEEVRKGGYIPDQWTEQLREKASDPSEFGKTMDIYGGLQRLIERYNLNAVSVRCFELLKEFNSTGCLALAILNAKGIPAACEGDVKSLVTMAASQAVTGMAGFMANPSYCHPESREIIFAHCTLPLNMAERYDLTTHYESKKGLATAAELPVGRCTVFKTNGIFTENYIGLGTIEENLHRDNLCRTQIRVRMDEDQDIEYLLRRPIANHQIILPGEFKTDLEAFISFVLP